jgi:alpha 1,3-glucosidase
MFEIAPSTDNGHVLVVELTALAAKSLRLRLNDRTSLFARYTVKDVLLEPLATTAFTVVERSAAQLKLAFAGDCAVVVTAQPFRVDLYRGDVLAASINSRGLLRWEEYRVKPEGGEGEGMWEEMFKTHHDSKPRGPASGALSSPFFSFFFLLLFVSSLTPNP